MARAEARINIVGKDKSKAAFRSATSSMDRFKLAAKSAVATMGPLLAIGGVTGLVIIGKQALDAADSIQKMSQRLSISTEALSQYRHVAALSGTDFESLAKAIKKSQKTIADAEDGLSTAVIAMTDMGLSVSDLVKMSPEDAFEAMGEAIANIPDPFTRASAAAAVYGRSGQDLIPIFIDGAEAVKAMREEADELGLTLSQYMADKAADANDAITRMTGAVDGLKTSLSVLVAPKITSGVTWIVDRFKEMSAAVQESEQIARVTAKMKELQDFGLDQQFKGSWGSVDLKAFRQYAEFLVKSEDQQRKLTASRVADREAMDDWVSSSMYAVDEHLKWLALADEMPQKIGETTPFVADLNSELLKTVEAASTASGVITEMFTDEDIAAIDAHVAGLNEVNSAADDMADTLGRESERAADRMAGAISAAVFESKDLLQSLSAVAKSVFGSILSSFIGIGVRSILPIPSFGGDFVGPASKSAAPAGAGGVSVGNLNVKLDGTFSDDPISVRNMAVKLYDELQKVGSHHG